MAMEEQGNTPDAERLRQAKWAAYGTTVPGRQTTPRAEAYAFIRLVQRTLLRPELPLVVDALYLVKGVECSRREVYAAGRNGDLWRKIYAEVELRPLELDIRKVKSHRTVRDVQAGVGVCDGYGNDLADKAAEQA